MKELSIQKGKIIDDGFNTRETLLKYINKDSCDLVVIGSRGTSGFQTFLGSMASSIIREARADIFVYVPVD